MEEEIRLLRESLLQLQADNERFRQECAAAQGGPGAAAAASSAPVVGPAVAATERLVVVPRDRKCPMFNGRSGIGIVEWVEEVQACARARHLSAADQALFIFDHLEGEAKEEIRFRSDEERRDPARVLAILTELYGCSQSYVTLQQAFFSRHQQEGETLQEFSLALMALMARVEQHAPGGMPNADTLLRDQFIEHVLDSSLRRELKQLVRRQPTITLLELRLEAIRWEREGLPGGARGRSQSLPTAYGFQYGVQGHPPPAPQVAPQVPGLNEVMELLRRQQEQLSQLTQTVASLQGLPPSSSAFRSVNRRRGRQVSHFAREGDREWVHPRRRTNSVTGVNPDAAMPPFSSQQPEN